MTGVSEVAVRRSLISCVDIPDTNCADTVGAKQTITLVVERQTVDVARVSVQLL